MVANMYEFPADDLGLIGPTTSSPQAPNTYMMSFLGVKVLVVDQ